MSVFKSFLVAMVALAAAATSAAAQFSTSTFGGGANAVPSFVPQFGGMQTTSPMTIGRPVNGAAAAAQAAAAAAIGAADTQPNSPHNHMQLHGLAGYNATGIVAGTGSLNFTTTWTPNSAGQTPDLDTHVLLAPGYGPYTVSGGQSPFGVNTATRPWPYGSAEFERNVYYVQPTIAFAGATATFSGDVDGSTTLTGNCARSGGACEEVRITGTVPGGEYRQDTYRPLARPGTPANPSGAGSTYQTTVWATPGVVVDSVTVNGVRQFANQLGDFRTAAMSGSLLTDTGRSPEVVVNVRNVSPHAEGALSGSRWVRGQQSSLGRPIRARATAGASDQSDGSRVAVVASRNVSQRSHAPLAAITPPGIPAPQPSPGPDVPLSLPSPFKQWLPAVYGTVQDNAASIAFDITEGVANINALVNAAKVLTRAKNLYQPELSVIAESKDAERALNGILLSPRTSKAANLLERGKVLAIGTSRIAKVADFIPAAIEGYSEGSYKGAALAVAMHADNFAAATVANSAGAAATAAGVVAVAAIIGTTLPVATVTTLAVIGGIAVSLAASELYDGSALDKWLNTKVDQDAAGPAGPQ